MKIGNKVSAQVNEVALNAFQQRESVLRRNEIFNGTIPERRTLKRPPFQPNIARYL